jgi:hypothetical protein
MSSAIPPQAIKQRLEAGERLLWWDQPKQGLMLRKSDLYLIPFSLFWAGFAIIWETLAVTGNAPWFFKLWGIPFVLIGIYFVGGRFFYDSSRRRRLYYGLTDSRVLIATPNSCRTLTLDSLGEIMLEEERNGEGTIAFGREPPVWANAGWWSGIPTVPTLERIREARQVFAAIRRAQKRTAEEPQE